MSTVYTADGIEKGNAPGGESQTQVFNTDGTPKSNVIGGGGPGAPASADYVVGTANASLSAELVASDTTTIEFTGSGSIATWDVKYRGCRVYHNTTQAITNNSLTAVLYNSENDDTPGFHSIVSNTSRLTVPAGYAGRYRITAHVRWAANGTGRRDAKIYLNGSGSTLLAEMSMNPPVGVTFSMPSLATEYTLAVGDYVEVYVLQTSGATLNLDGQTYASFDLSLIGV